MKILLFIKNNYKVVLICLLVLFIGILFAYDSIEDNRYERELREYNNRIASLQDSVRLKDGTIVRLGQENTKVSTENEEILERLSDQRGKIESQVSYISYLEDSLQNIPTTQTIYIDSSGQELEARDFEITTQYSRHSGTFLLQEPYSVLNFNYSVWDSLEINILRYSNNYEVSVTGQNPNFSYRNLSLNRVIDRRTFWEKIYLSAGLGLWFDKNISLSAGVQYDTYEVSLIAMPSTQGILFEKKFNLFK